MIASRGQRSGAATELPEDGEHNLAPVTPLRSRWQRRGMADIMARVTIAPPVLTYAHQDHASRRREQPW